MNSDDGKVGIGGAPTRNTTLPVEADARKGYPVATGLMDYFPDALAYISHISWVANNQHNPGQPLHWNRGKSQDEADTMMRHFLQRGSEDSDGLLHSGKVCWRALAMFQKELEEAKKISPVTPERATVYHPKTLPDATGYSEGNYTWGNIATGTPHYLDAESPKGYTRHIPCQSSNTTTSEDLK